MLNYPLGHLKEKLQPASPHRRRKESLHSHLLGRVHLFSKDTVKILWSKSIGLLPLDQRKFCSGRKRLKRWRKRMSCVCGQGESQQRLGSAENEVDFHLNRLVWTCSSAPSGWVTAHPLADHDQRCPPNHRWRQASTGLRLPNQAVSPIHCSPYIHKQSPWLPLRAVTRVGPHASDR